MKRNAWLVMAAIASLWVGYSAPKERCRDKSDSAASISIDYCMWNQAQANNDRRTPGEWNSIVTWPSGQRDPANDSGKRGANRIFR